MTTGESQSQLEIKTAGPEQVTNDHLHYGSFWQSRKRRLAAISIGLVILVGAVVVCAGIGAVPVPLSATFNIGKKDDNLLQ